MIAQSNQYSPSQWWSVNWLSLEQPSECLVPTQQTSTGLCLSRLILREKGPNQVSKRLRYNNMEHSPISKSKSNIIGFTLRPTTVAWGNTSATLWSFHKWLSHSHTQWAFNPLSLTSSFYSFTYPTLGRIRARLATDTGYLSPNTS